jgi:DNA-binding NarL/FixJ family response regulator
MRILIADDHPFIRKGIRETLAELIGHSEVEEASDGEEAYALLCGRSYELAIVDIAMPGRGGLELIKDALAQKPGLRFLVMSIYPEREFAERAYDCGAMGYLVKTSPPAEFLEAVRRILGGGVYVSPQSSSCAGGGRTRGERGSPTASSRLSASSRRVRASPTSGGGCGSR